MATRAISQDFIVAGWNYLKSLLISISNQLISRKVNKREKLTNNNHSQKQKSREFYNPKVLRLCNTEMRVGLPPVAYLA